MMALMTPSRVLSLVLTFTLSSLCACRDPAELSGAVTAVLIVVGVDDENTVEVDIGGASRRARPAPGDNLVSFNLPLAPGTHVGTVVVFELDDEDGEAERPRDCGSVTIVLPEIQDDGPVLSAVVAEDLGECPDDEGEPVDDEGTDEDP